MYELQCSYFCSEIKIVGHIDGAALFWHSIDLTFKKLKGPWLFRRPASFPSTVKGFSADEPKASFPDHSIEFTHLEFPAQIRIRLCTHPAKQETIVEDKIMGKRN